MLLILHYSQRVVINVRSSNLFPNPFNYIVTLSYIVQDCNFMLN